MPRPQKNGIDYFSFDCDFYSDRKVRRIMKSCGPTSGTVLTSLLCNIYHENGYYIGWDEDLPFDIADLLGMSEGQVRETIHKAVSVGFFNQDQFETNKILTSAGIQKRYLQATARRVNTDYNPEYWLLEQDVDNSKPDQPAPKPEEDPPAVNDDSNSESVYRNPVNDDRNPENVYRSTQTKVKQTKVKQRKVNQADLSTTVNRFIAGFEKRFSVRFSRDNISALKNSVLKYREAIEIEYTTVEIFLRTILRRMEDISTKKPLNNPVGFFFSGAFGANKYLWSLTAEEEATGSGYHKPLINEFLSKNQPLNLGAMV